MHSQIRSRDEGAARLKLQEKKQTSKKCVFSQVSLSEKAQTEPVLRFSPTQTVAHQSGVSTACT